jgi:hypothetical protein
MRKVPHCRASRFGIWPKGHLRPQSLSLYIGERERHPVILIIIQGRVGRDLDCAKGAIPQSGRVREGAVSSAPEGFRPLEAF